MSEQKILATFAVGSIEELVESHRGRSIDCNPSHLSPEYADDLCILADKLEAMGHSVVPSRSKRNAALNRVLKKIAMGC